MLSPPEPLLTPDERVAQIVSYYRRRPSLNAITSSLALLGQDAPGEVARLLAGLNPAWSDHAVASVYAALMGKSRRKALGAYFTPPGLVDYLLKRAREFGVDFAEGRLRDPAAGGAAFIVPIAREMVRLWRAETLDDAAITARLAARLTGREIDPGLAALANALLQRCLVEEYGFDPALAGALNVITEADTLAIDHDHGADHEIGNPPFLRLASREEPPNVDRFEDINSGRLNLYSIFVRRGLAALPPGGVLAYIIPASFIGGPEFNRFRLRIRQLAEVLAVDMIEGRSSVFMDVVQDTCVLVLRKRAAELGEVAETEAASNSVGGDGAFRASGTVTLPPGDRPWVLPGAQEDLPSTLAEWGYSARIGYLVANRQADRLHERRAQGRVPLIWAKAIGQDGTFDFARGAQFRELNWVDAPAGAPYIARSACVAVQRTSARGQKRRITAAEIPVSFVEQYGGVIAENHVILLLPTRSDAVPASALAKALNLPQVGEQLDRMCGSASIPARLLEQVPLPAVPGR
ncbi:Eco57I restriction-modification methylase domain-containing protein [Neorhizobium petrolearium]|uniref:Eco57I restriction-modification methylase domain-containing protein n=1 Tax=Neorhizobium petrolearium TaxID=515361 RepID=UPI003F81BCF3